MLTTAFPAYVIAVILAVPLSMSVWRWFRVRFSGVPHQTAAEHVSAWPRVVNSAVLFALAYNTVFLIQELFLVLPKAFLGMQPTLFHNNHEWRVDHPAQDLLQGTGALAIFVVGLVFVGICTVVRSGKGPFRLFAIWMVYQGLTQSLPQLADPVMNPDGDVGDALSYLGVGQNLGVFLAYLSFAVVVFVGIQLAKPILELAPSEEDLQTPGARARYVFQTGVLAGLLGLALIIPFRLPPFEFQRMIGPFIIAFFPMLWLLATAPRVEDTNPTGNTINDRVAWLPVALLLLLLAVCQLFLAPGVPFY